MPVVPWGTTIPLSPILAKFVNMCACKGIYLDLLKKALIRPIYKQGSHLNYSNNRRPIAILSVINKITEKVIVQQDIRKYNSAYHESIVPL